MKETESCIDFVIIWVNDSDPQWQAERQKYAVEDTGFMNKNDCRYRDWGTLRYWFRSVEWYAPWVRKVHFVTCGHYPEWLNLDHPKLNFVRHKDYIPSEYLPTFSANPIELNLHRIEGLAEQFVFFNDDMFVAAPVRPSDFFKKGLPKDIAIRTIPLLGDIGLIDLNDINIINREFYFYRQFMKNKWKWVNYRYGLQVLRSLVLFPYRDFTGMKNTHVANSYKKTIFKEVWSKYGNELDKTCRHRFRSPMDVNQWLFKYWQVVSGNFYPQSMKSWKYLTIDDTKNLISVLKSRKTKLICLNDTEEITDYDNMRGKVIDIFETIFPKKSSFENNM